MKLNFREKIILGCFLAIAILLGAFLGLVKPKTKQLKENQERLEQLKSEREEMENKINQIGPLKTKINEIFEDTNKLAELFVPSEDVDTPVELDEMLQKYADENNVRILSLDAGTPSVTKLDYYYYSSSDYAASYRESVDLGGQLQQQYDEDHKESLALNDREVEDLFETKYGIKVQGTKENIFKYLEAIKDYDKAMNIRSIQISDYTFGEAALEEARNAGSQIAQAIAPAEEEAPAEEAEAETTEAETPAESEEPEAEAQEEASAPTAVVVDGKTITNESECQIVMSVYSVFTMPTPNVDYIPDAN